MLSTVATSSRKNVFFLKKKNQKDFYFSLLQLVWYRGKQTRGSKKCSTPNKQKSFCFFFFRKRSILSFFSNEPFSAQMDVEIAVNRPTTFCPKLLMMPRRVTARMLAMMPYSMEVIPILSARIWPANGSFLVITGLSRVERMAMPPRGR
jgi:hypothetical protein